jgi:hypothetical protein
MPATQQPSARELLRAIEQNELRLHYQPIVSLQAPALPVSGYKSIYPASLAALLPLADTPFLFILGVVKACSTLHPLFSRLDNSDAGKHTLSLHSCKHKDSPLYSTIVLLDLFLCCCLRVAHRQFSFEYPKSLFLRSRVCLFVEGSPISQESFKAFTPSIANCNASATIVLVISILWIVATLNHVRPNSVQSCFTSTWGMTMLCYTLPSNIRLKTPARLSVSSTQRLQQNFALFAAITKTFKDSIRSTRRNPMSGNFLNDCQPTKSIARIYCYCCHSPLASRVVRWVSRCEVLEAPAAAFLLF